MEFLIIFIIGFIWYLARPSKYKHITKKIDPIESEPDWKIARGLYNKTYDSEQFDLY